MTNAVLQAIAQRRSNRGYAPTQLTEEQIEAILLAAVQAPSARNTQPWHFSVVQNAGLLRAFVEDYNRLCANPSGKDGLFFAAPTVVFITTPVQAPTRFSQIDCGIAVENMALAAHSLGLGSVILGRPREVFDDPACRKKYQAAFGIPEGYEFAIAIALGNPTLSKEAHPVREGIVTRVK